MSYQVLARKWRPRDFDSLVGQSHVVRALANALDGDRVHHAFLFTGTRGVGKTTVARVLAKCLNCDLGVGSKPCGTCAACTEIDEGRFVDLIEVDAASRSKVDETRELMDNVQFSPARGRYKVYLIDEVHMFSEKSFNALLKTLEEPPPHVKFLLATTDPQKLPITVLSRCLQFNLKRLPPDAIADHLERILDSEAIEHEPPALRHLARAADGSMRDALSLLDQAIAYGGGRLSEAEVRAMIGSLDRRHVIGLLEGLSEGDPAGLLARVETMSGDVTDYGEALAELLSELQRLAVLQAVPDAPVEEDEAAGDRRSLAEAIAPADLQLFYQIGLHARRDLPLAPDPRGGFEMAMLRMLAFRPATGSASAASPAGRGESGAPARDAPAAVSAAGPAVAGGDVEKRRPASREARPAEPSADHGAPSEAAPTTRADRAARAERAVQATSGPPEPPWPAEPPDLREPEHGAAPIAVAPGAGQDVEPAGWVELVASLPLAGLSRELAANCSLIAVDGDQLQLEIAPRHEQLRAPGIAAKLEHALGAHLGREVRLHFRIATPSAETPARRERRDAAERHASAVRAIEEDPAVRALCETFDAEIDADQVRPA